MEKEIKMVATVKDNFEKDACWCISFNVAWKHFVEEYLKNDYSCKENKLIKNLNEEYKLNYTCDKNDLYVKLGCPTTKMKQEIEQGIKEKFDVESDILSTLKFFEEENEAFLIYTMLYFDSGFRYKYKKYNKGIRFGFFGKKVDAFGANFDSGEDDMLLRQTDTLFYENKDECAIELKTMDNKSIYIYKTKTQDTFENVFSKMIEKGKNFDDSVYHEKTNVLERKYLRKFKAPNLNFMTKIKYNDLIGKQFFCNSTKLPYEITEAIQTLKFSLNNEGTKVKSEAAIGGICTSCASRQVVVYKPYDIIINKSFYVFIANDNNPVVAIHVDNINKFI